MLTLFGPLNLLSKIAGGFLIGALLFTSLMWRIERHQRVKADAQVVKIAAAREADRAAYVAAQKQAAELNRQTVQRIETHQQRITANVEADLTSRLERLRSELRKQGAANQGAARGTGAGGVPQAAPGAAPGAGVHLTPEQLLSAAENEERHEQLIRWVQEQMKVQR